MFNPVEKQFILQLARTSIEHYFATGKLLKMKEEEMPFSLKEERSCFVTLKSAGVLRGCIGRLEPAQPLYLDIIENAVGSAFADARFVPLSSEEYKLIDLEISVLTTSQELNFFTPEELLQKLRPGIDGVIIRLGENSATYLPQVWEDLPDKIHFLDSLCEKAGLVAGDWKKQGMKVLVYQVEIVK